MTMLCAGELGLTQWNEILIYIGAHKYDSIEYFLRHFATYMFEMNYFRATKTMFLHVSPAKAEPRKALT